VSQLAVCFIEKVGETTFLHNFMKSGWGIISILNIFVSFRNGTKLVRNSVKCDVLNNKMPQASGGLAPGPPRPPWTQPLELIRNGRKQIQGGRNVVSLVSVVVSFR